MWVLYVLKLIFLGKSVIEFHNFTNNLLFLLSPYSSISSKLIIIFSRSNVSVCQVYMNLFVHCIYIIHIVILSFETYLPPSWYPCSWHHRALLGQEDVQCFPLPRHHHHTRELDVSIGTACTSSPNENRSAVRQSSTGRRKLMFCFMITAKSMLYFSINIQLLYRLNGTFEIFVGIFFYAYIRSIIFD